LETIDDLKGAKMAQKILVKLFRFLGVKEKDKKFQYK
jgi:hypothetical protein